MTGLLELLRLLQAGFMLIQLPGVPVEIISFQEGFAVACVNPGGLYLIQENGSIQGTSHLLSEPAGLALWNSSTAVSDRLENTVALEDTLFSLPGSPEGICQVHWFSSRESDLAVCLFDVGQVVLLGSDGRVSPLADVPGAKDITSLDSDSDGDMDLLVSGCGTGVILLENNGSVPVVHELGSIGAGVKRIVTGDIDNDGNVDVAGIACADGGVGWWRNPGTSRGYWEYSELNGKLLGPKYISGSGDSLVVVSLFSSVYTSYQCDPGLPAGFTCCLVQEGGRLILGHHLGFIGISE